MKGNPAPGTAEHQLGIFKDEGVARGFFKNAEMGQNDPERKRTADLVVGDPGEGKNAELVLGGPGKNIPGRGWYTRGYLPHYDEAGALQMITYRLADSLPQRLLEEMEESLASLPRNGWDLARRQQLEKWLDAGYGSCVLRRSEAARCVMETWGHFDGGRYELVAGVVMPNHVHVLIKLMDGVPLGKVVQSWKSYTGRRIAGMMEDCRAGARRSQEQKTRGVWMRDYWDRFIRDEKHFVAAVEYIHMNPVKAGLVEKAEDWYWSTGGMGERGRAGARRSQGKKFGLGNWRR